MIENIRKRTLQIVAILMVLLFSAMAMAEVPIHIFNSSKTGFSTLKSGDIKALINESVDISEEDHRKVNVKVIYEQSGEVDYLIVYLLSKAFYSFKTVRVELENNKVTSVVYDYTESGKDFSQGSVELYKGTCPDSSVEMVFATCETGIASAVQGVNSAAEIASDAGYTVKTLKGNQENRQAILPVLVSHSTPLSSSTG